MKGGGEGNVSAGLLEKGTPFSTSVGQKPESFFFLQCWGVVGWLFAGAGMCKHIQRQSWRFDSSLVRVYFGAQVAFKIEDQSNLPRIFSSFLNILSTFFYHLFFINCLSTSYKLFVNLFINCSSAVYQLFINSLSTFYQLFINFLSTLYQLCINLLTTCYQDFINFLSTFYQLCISCMSTFHQHMTNVLLKISKSFLFVDSLLFCMNFAVGLFGDCWSRHDYLMFL